MNPTGCDPKTTSLHVLMTLGIVFTMAIADRFMVRPPTIETFTTGPLYIKESRGQMTKVDIDCKVAGISNQRDIIWLHNEQPLQHIDCDGNSPDQEYCMMTSVKSRLCIKSSNMVGEFRCQADNGHGVAISDKTLVHKAVLKIRRVKPVEVRIKLGGSHEFIMDSRLHAYSYPPEKTTISWEFENKSEVQNERYLKTEEGTLYLTNVSPDDDNLILICRIENKEINAIKQCGQYKIKVIESMQQTQPKCTTARKYIVAEAGKDVTLQCTCSGVPAVDVKWDVVYSKTMHIKRHTLKLPAISVNQTGTYRCKAGNSEHGSAQMEFHVQVQSKPTSTVDDEPKSLEVSRYEKSASFYCKGKGVPTPTASWYINGKPINAMNLRESITHSADGGVLTIGDLHLDTAMTVYCNLSNSMGYKWLQATLVVNSDLTPQPPASAIPVTKQKDKTPPTPASPTTTDQITTLDSRIKTTKKPLPTKSSSITKKTTRKVVTQKKPQKTVTSPTQKTLVPLKHTTKGILDALSPDKHIGGSSKPVYNITPLTTLNYGTVEIGDDNLVKFQLPIKYILIGALVFGFIVIIIAIVCTYLCVKCCQRRKEEQAKQIYPRSNTLSNLSYISHIARMRDFDGESEDSGIDERSVLKSKTSLPRIEAQENHKNEADEMIVAGNQIMDVEQNGIMEHHL